MYIGMVHVTHIWAIALISLILTWKYTKFCRQIAIHKGYFWSKLESTQNKRTLFSCQVIVKFVIVIIKFVIATVTHPLVLLITNSSMLLRFENSLKRSTFISIIVLGKFFRSIALMMHLVGATTNCGKNLWYYST